MQVLRLLGEIFIFPLQVTGIIIALCSPFLTIFAVVAWSLHVFYGVNILSGCF